MLPIPEVSDLDMAFPAHALDWMPAWEKIPKEFCTYKGTVWNQLVSEWFYKGIAGRLSSLRAKPGVDDIKALRVIQAILGSYAPQHEHKMAATAYMMSEWFDLEE